MKKLYLGIILLFAFALMGCNGLFGNSNNSNSDYYESVNNDYDFSQSIATFETLRVRTTNGYVDYDCANLESVYILDNSNLVVIDITYHTVNVYSGTWEFKFLNYLGDE